jgi:arginyl-tRNA synthetase
MNRASDAKQNLIRMIERAVAVCGFGTEPGFRPQVEVPKEKEHGDFATNVAMQLAKRAKRPPRQIAEMIVEALDREAAGIERVEIAGPGFINFFLRPLAFSAGVTKALQRGAAYGRVNVGENRRVQIEFVSANPTGSLHIGHARGAAFGDSLARILSFAGFDVTREYYINDAGNQIDNLGKSVVARYLQALGEDAPMPDDGYMGQDVIEVAEEIVRRHGDTYRHVDSGTRQKELQEMALQFMLDRIREDLARFRVTFHEWFSERSLYADGQVSRAVDALRERGFVYEKDGAQWFRSTAFGDDKDRVLVKNDGSFTYLTPDIAYHRNKFQRGYDLLINVWGQDHHGYVPRIKAAMAALGYDPDRLKIILSQMVLLYQNGEPVKMSKRTGRAVTLRDLMDEVGVDAARYFLVMRSVDSHMDFDLDLAVAASNENPVYYVQYAHARIASILRQASQQGISSPPENADLGLLREDLEVALMKKVEQFPEEVAGAATDMAPHRIVRYLHELAQALHSFYNAHRVMVEDRRLAEARLALVLAVKIVIRNGLELIGVSAPETM